MLLINGASGFIGQALLKDLDHRNIKYKTFGRRIVDTYDNETMIQNASKILFLSSPSDSNDFKNKEKTSTSMIDDYVYNLNYIKNTNPDAEIIFGSSVGANPITFKEMEEFLENDYAIFKLAMEKYIKANFKNFKIIRIPRVYGKDRRKGLMKLIKETPLENLNIGTPITFMDIDDFIPKLIKAITKKSDNYKNITHFVSKLKTMNVKEIKKYYNL